MDISGKNLSKYPFSNNLTTKMLFTTKMVKKNLNSSAIKKNIKTTQCFDCDRTKECSNTLTLYHITIQLKKKFI